MVDQTPKVVLLGDTAVGKTSIIKRFQGTGFSTEVVPTIGAAYAMLKLDQGPVKVWDTAGQETFRSLTPMYYRGAHLVLLVFAVNHRDTFASLPAWIKEVKEQAHAPDIILVGNKTDMRNDSGDCVENAEATAFADSQGANYIETSCKNEEGLDSLLHYMAETAYKKASAAGEAAVPVPLEPEPQGKKCAC
jgi:small GTP-binding protein